jgi:esterase/lipase superfamily enzyme
MKKVFFTVSLVILLSCQLYAAQSTIVDVEGNACMGDDKSRKQTEQAAMADAKRNAAERAMTYLKSETQVKDFAIEKDLVNAYAQATVEVIKELEKTWFKDANSGDCYRIRIQAEIVPDENAMKKAAHAKDFTDDPAAPLKVKLWADKQEYKQGEKVKIYIRGNKPFHARILYKNAAGNQLQLLPNPYSRENYFNGGVTYEIPSENDLFDLEVSPPFGQEDILIYAATSALGDINLAAQGGVYRVESKSADVRQLTRGLKIQDKFDGSKDLPSEFSEEVLSIRTGPPEPAKKEAAAPAQRDLKAAGLNMRGYEVVRVYFATDRNITESEKPAEMFGTYRAPISYGTCNVSIPGKHTTGELEAPILRLKFLEDPSKHVVMLDAIVQTKDKFFSDLSAQIRASGGKKAFLFVHGYNVTFRDAARRTAQISHDLQFDGAPVFYSWPSQAAKAAVTIDEQNIEWAQANIKRFLDDFFERSDADNVFLIAHSMGNRALTRAVASLLAQKPSIRQRLREVILAAPDIDAEVFRRDIAPALTASNTHITLYASSHDLALEACKKIYGYPRAGDSDQGLVVVPGIETIDATGTDTSLFGHSYYAHSRSVLNDISDVIRNGLRAEQRSGLRGIDTPSGRYWVFTK